jgi:hypothetical protein
MSYRLAANWNGFTSVSNPGKVAVVAALTLLEMFMLTLWMIRKVESNLTTTNLFYFKSEILNHIAFLDFDPGGLRKCPLQKLSATRHKTRRPAK